MGTNKNQERLSQSWMTENGMKSSDERVANVLWNPHALRVERGVPAEPAGAKEVFLQPEDSC